MTSLVLGRCLLSSRFYCQHSKQLSQQTSSPGSKFIKPLTGIRQYIFKKCVNFIQGYERILETKFPSAFRVYQVFSVGTRDLYADIKDYIQISSLLRNGKLVQDLQRRELEKYFKVPKDLMKVSPVLLIAALPFANYVILPVIYFFPRQFLTSHFWSLQQRVEFAVKGQRKKLYSYRPVFRYMQAKVNSIENGPMKSLGIELFSKIGSGTHPSVEDILEAKPLFVGKPYGLSSLTSRHMLALCRMHDLSGFPGKRSRLMNHGGFIREMDLAILREGVSTMNQDELRAACFLRGLNPMNLSKEDIVDFLTKWVAVAKDVDNESLSLLLHCPILLAYNNTSNWMLIH